MRRPSRLLQERRVSSPPYLNGHPDGTVVACWVVPGASRTEIKGLHGDSLRLRVSAPPEGGRANQEVCRLLEQRVGGSAEILSGQTAKAKRILLRGVTLEVASDRLP